MNKLHITNGDHAATLIQQANPSDEVIAWDDILYEGPIHSDMELVEFSKTRAQYLSEAKYSNLHEITDTFIKRDTKLKSYTQFEEIILWFEHDLYDQLQLLQLLNWLAQNNSTKQKRSLICINKYPEVEPFYGLGQLSVQQIAPLFPTRKPISAQELTLGKIAWQAFGNKNPLALTNLLHDDLSCLPYLKNAVSSYLQSFPSRENGLNRTEQYILNSINNGLTHPLRILGELPIVEGKYYTGMGDTTFGHIIRQLAEANSPLITLENYTYLDHGDIRFSRNTKVALTTTGQKIRTGEIDAIKLNGIDRWLGGVHLTPDNCWRWDNQQQKLLK